MRKERKKVIQNACSNVAGRKTSAVNNFKKVISATGKLCTIVKNKY
jgi:hypothetical protein